MWVLITGVPYVMQGSPHTHISHVSTETIKDIYPENVPRSLTIKVKISCP